MTTTDKPVTRRTRFDYSVLYASASKARPIVVKIAAGDILQFREHGRRAVFSLAIDTAFKYAVRLTAFHQAAEQARQDPRPRRSRKGARR